MKWFALLLVIGCILTSCVVPGTVVFEKVNGEWQATEVSIQRQNITPGAIQDIEDRLNGK